jgi:3-hydroxyisobutyrate dehydrogenase
VAKAGAIPCESLAELASRSDVVITVVSDTTDVRAVLFGRDALASGLRAGSIVIDMSTISPNATSDFAERLRQRDVTMLDAPVSGGQSGAIAGTLSIMVGGDEEAFRHCMAIFEAMGQLITYMGPSGNGQKTKLVNQIVVALNLLATVEALRVASTSGLDLNKLLKAIGEGAAGSWMLSNLGPKIVEQDFRAGFAIRLQQKDLRLASEFLHELGLDAPGTDLTHSLFTAALEKGLGDAGTQGLYKLWS